MKMKKPSGSMGSHQKKDEGFDYQKGADAVEPASGDSPPDCRIEIGLNPIRC